MSVQPLLSESKKKYERDVTRKATGFKSMQLNCWNITQEI